MFSARDVTVRLGRRPALEIHDLTLGAGELVSLIGPNGAGKTTLLRLLAGLVSPSTGTLTRDGSHVAYVSQRHDLDRWLPVTVDEVLRMGRYHRLGMFRRMGPDDRAAVSTAAERLEITDLQRQNFGELSGGQQQRVRIASALVSDAPCLLLDEPLTGLDATSQQVIADVAAQERDRGRLVVVSTHRLGEAAQSDRVLVLATRLLSDGPPNEALTPGSLAAAFGTRVVGLETGIDEPKAVLLIDDHGHPHDTDLR